MVPHTAFPKCITTTTKATMNTTTRVHVTKAVIVTHHKIGGEVPDIRFLSNHTRKQTKVTKEKERGPHNLQIHNKGQLFGIVKFSLIL